MILWLKIGRSDYYSRNNQHTFLRASSDSISCLSAMDQPGSGSAMRAEPGLGAGTGGSCGTAAVPTYQVRLI